MDFDLNSVTKNFKNPTFKVLAIGALGVGVIVLLNKNKQSTSNVDDETETEDTKTIIYQNEGGYTTDDIQNYTENMYYSLAETVGEGIEGLGNLLLESQEKGFSNIQDILSNNNDDSGINDNDSEVPDKPTTPTKKTTTKKYVTVGTWGKDPITKTTLSGIAQKAGISLSKLLSFPENSKYRKNPNLIHPGDRVRVK